MASTPQKNDNNPSGEDLPGYPHYAAGEDITRAGNSNGKADVDVENINASGRRAGTEQQGTDSPRAMNSNETPGDADVTAEDINMLSASDQNRDMDDPDSEESFLDETDEDGDPLNEPRGTYDKAGADLDVPGSEDDDRDEAEGGEDEENNYYSLGGDNHESGEETKDI